MEDAIITLAIGCSSTLFFSIPFAFFAFLRYLRYKETIALAENGLLRPSGRFGRGGTSRWGVALTSIGAALTLGLWPIGFLIDETPLGLGPWMIPGLLPLFFGIGLLRWRKANAEPEAAIPPAVELPDPDLDDNLDWHVPASKIEID